MGLISKQKLCNASCKILLPINVRVLFCAAKNNASRQSKAFWKAMPAMLVPLSASDVIDHGF